MPETPVATVTIRTLRITYLRGFLMYLVAVLQTIALNLDAPLMYISTDKEAWNEETIMVTLCNGPREGGGFTVAPGADVSDGVLNYASVRAVSKLMMLRLMVIRRRIRTAPNSIWKRRG